MSVKSQIFEARVVKYAYECAELRNINERRSRDGDRELIQALVSVRLPQDPGYPCLTLLSQLEEPPRETPLARSPRGKTSEMMIHATGPHLSAISVTAN